MSLTWPLNGYCCLVNMRSPRLITVASSPTGRPITGARSVFASRECTIMRSENERSLGAGNKAQCVGTLHFPRICLDLRK